MRRLLGSVAALALLTGCGIAAPDEPDHTLPSVAAPATTAASPTAAAPSEAPFVRPTVATSALLARFAYDAKAPLGVKKADKTQIDGNVVTYSITYEVAGGPPIV